MKDKVVKPLLDYLSHMTQTNERMKSFNNIIIFYILKVIIFN